MQGNIHVQQIYSMHEATSTYASHVLVSASLQVATPTNPSRYLFAYHEYTLLGTCNAFLTQFLSVFHSLPIRVTSQSDPDCYPGHPGQQSWPCFNAGSDNRAISLAMWWPYKYHCIYATDTPTWCFWLHLPRWENAQNIFLCGACYLMSIYGMDVRITACHKLFNGDGWC